MIVRFIRFGIVGATNTLLSLALISITLSVSPNDYAANAIGYAGGLAFSYIANRHWTFEKQGDIHPSEIIAFLLTFIIAYSANLIALALMRSLGYGASIIAHVPGMVAYSGFFFALSQRYVFSEKNTSFQVMRFILKYWPELLLCMLSLITCFALAQIPLTHDVRWQLWIARALLNGATLYENIWELNPPLWFWSAMPVVRLADALSIAPSSLLVIETVLLGMVSALAVGKLGHFSTAGQRAAAMVMLFWFCVPMPLFDFGQREQQALICALPYAALIARRRAGDAVPAALAMGVGLLAAYGFALKHYFIIIPCFLELWMILHVKRHWRLVRPEITMMIVVAALYAWATLALAPNFLRYIVPMVTAAYHGYEVPLIQMIDEPAQMIWLIALVALAINPHLLRYNPNPLAIAFLLVAAGFAFSYAVQMKGWQYHAIPVTGALLAALAIALIHQGWRRALNYPLALCAIGFAVFVGAHQGVYENWLSQETDAKLRSVPAGQPVAVIAADPMFSWPAVDDLKLRWPLRYYSYWMLPAIGNVAVRPSDPSLTRPLATMILDQTAHDLKCDPPALILLEKAEYSYGTPRRYFDVKKFFLSDPAIGSFIRQHYREDQSTLRFASFRRTAAVPRQCDKAFSNLSKL